MYWLSISHYLENLSIKRAGVILAIKSGFYLL